MSSYHYLIQCFVGYTRVSELWTPIVAKSRYESLLKKYKETKRDFLNPNGPKFCLTDTELASGMTLDMKRDKLCPHFSRWDNLFGSRQNIVPSSVIESIDEENKSDGETEDDQYLNGVDDEVHSNIQLHSIFNPENDVNKPSETSENVIVNLKIIDEEDNVPTEDTNDPIVSLPPEAQPPAIQPPPVLIPIPSDAVVRTNVPKDVPRKRYSKPKPVTSDVNPVLVALSAQAASDASGSGESKLTKRKSDFNSVYTANKTREMEIARERLDFDRDMATAEREFNEKKLALEEKKIDFEIMREQSALKETTRKETIALLIKEGKSPEEVKAYLDMLGM